MGLLDPVELLNWAFFRLEPNLVTVRDGPLRNVRGPQGD